MAYSEEQRRSAPETFIRFDHSHADTIAELGYPNRGTLRGWWREYERTGVVPVRKSVSDPTCTDAMKRAAADYYLGHGRSLARTARALGYPKSRQLPGEWIDEYAPGQRKRRGPGPDRGPVPLERKVQAVAELEARTGTAAEVAERNGVPRAAPCAWRREIMGHNGGRQQEKGLPVAKETDELPDDIGQLQDMLREAKARLRQVQPELDVREATPEIVKKDPGTDPNRLANREKAPMAEALRGRQSLRELLAAVGMAKSSYECAKGALARGEGPERAAAREAVRAAFGESGGAYGYRRIYAQANSVN